MKHLFSSSVYQDLDEDSISQLRSIGCDGIELLTGHSPVDDSFKKHTVSVHLPYTTDWISAWEGVPFDMDEPSTKYYMYGRNKDDIIDNVRKAIGYASVLNPCHGVFHMCNVRIPELISHRYSDDSEYVIRLTTELMNEVVSTFPGKEPPFKILFENLWWPGLKMIDDSEISLIEDNIRFKNWGVCLDTGHLMNSLPGIYNESNGIDALLKIFEGYSKETIDRIDAVHFHYSASGKYRENFEEVRYEGGQICDFIKRAYPHVCTLDQHLPFSDSRCRELLEALKPETVVHELPGNLHGPIEDFKQQRALLD